MSLLVTSCTMGKQPDRLLNKGPQYLRTRTNASLFNHHRKSAVELLAESKSQFYNIKASVPLDTHQDLAVSAGQEERYSESRVQKEPPRSKSDHHVSLLQHDGTDDEVNESFADVLEDSVDFSQTDAQENNHCENNVFKDTVEISQEFSDSHSSTFKEDILTLSVVTFSEDKKEKTSSEQLQKLTVECLNPSSSPENEIIYENITVDKKPQLNLQLSNAKIRKPVPLPRKRKEKPIPPPRKPLVTSSNDKLTKNLTLSPVNATSGKNQQQNSSPSRINILETSTSDEPFSFTNPKNVTRKPSLVEALTQHFSALSAASSSHFHGSYHLSKEETSPDVKPEPESTGTYTAAPIFITNQGTADSGFQVRRIFVAKNGFISNLSPAPVGIPELSDVNSETLSINKGRKRCPDIYSSSGTVKRDRKSIGSDSLSSQNGVMNSFASRIVPIRKNSSSSTHKEISMESVDQAVYESESEISAIPIAPMDSDNLRGEHEEARAIIRSNSSLSGKFEQQDTSPLSMSPTPHCSSVPRSHSDIGCHLESQHSRDSSLVSNHSRLSHASVGADLENFFNQMGLEKGVLEPISRLKDAHPAEVFDSMSSLDSHDAASICSTYSRSEQEWSDSQSADHSQQQTSIVERNARIIKWLCNVRKAKSQTQKSDKMATASKA